MFRQLRSTYTKTPFTFTAEENLISAVRDNNHRIDLTNMTLSVDRNYIVAVEIIDYSSQDKTTLKQGAGHWPQCP